MEETKVTLNQATAIKLLKEKGLSNREIIAKIMQGEFHADEKDGVGIALELLQKEFITWHDEDFDRLILALYKGYDIKL
ncbi:hypothetical protein [Priestia megaterium]|uniref:hypothetical protein n=1 Tax=Priestia megaterium TaxID=1404 RepID=UPI000BFBB1AE|nr:hypothetical protein [Priestia megaterium]PGO60739.1 hypothetical protein CN981_09380 [Priestia megaterium]